MATGALMNPQMINEGETIPAIAHVLLGFYIGKIMMETRKFNSK